MQAVTKGVMKLRSIPERLRRLENRPENMIPRFVATFENGRTETLWGAEILRYGKSDGVKCVLFDENHQLSVDQIALYSMLHPDVEILSK